MAIYHLSVKYFSRRKGQSAVAAAAYRSGEKLYDRYYGLAHDFTNKSGILHTAILLPESVPREFYDREILWNAVEYSEKRCDARLAREIEIALPNEFTLIEYVKLVEQYINVNFTCKGMCADYAIHDKGNGNPHAHILLTTRNVNENGFTKKNRSWDKKINVNLWRSEWSNVLNEQFEQKGLKTRVSHESYISRGIKREPTRHLGYKVMKLARSGIITDRIYENRAIVERNKIRVKRRHEIQRQQELAYEHGHSR